MAHFGNTFGFTTDAYLDLQDRIKDDCVSEGYVLEDTVTTGNFKGYILSSTGTADTSVTTWYLGIITTTDEPDLVRITVSEGWDSATDLFSGYVPLTSYTGSDTSGGNRGADSLNDYKTSLADSGIDSSNVGYLVVEVKDGGYLYELNVTDDRIVLATKTDTGTDILKNALYAGLLKPADLPNPPTGSDVQLGIGYLKVMSGISGNITSTSTGGSSQYFNRRFTTIERSVLWRALINDSNPKISFTFTRDPGQLVNDTWINGAFMGSLLRYGSSVGYVPTPAVATHINTTALVPNSLLVYGANGPSTTTGTTHQTMVSYPRGYLHECTLIDGISTEPGHTVEIDGFTYYNMNMNNDNLTVYVKGEAVGS